MAYDYDGLTASIRTHLEQAETSGDEKDKQNHWQAAMQAFETLQSHSCPLTPSLWIQYAQTSRKWMESESESSDAKETMSQILQLGLEEFPGSSILQHSYIENLAENIEEGILQALAHVGRGSHRNESQWIISLFMRLADYYVEQKDSDQVHNVFVFNCM